MAKFPASAEGGHVFLGFASGGRWGLLAVLGFAIMVAGSAAAYGQERSDTTATELAPPAAAPPDTLRAEDVGPVSQEDRVIVNADSLSAFRRNNERLQELFGDVRVQQDTTRLRSDYALRYLERDKLLFTDDVVIYERGDTLRADTVRYNKRTKVGRAWSNVRLTDGEVVVRAPYAIYHTAEKRSVFPDSVTLIDSTRVLRAASGTYWSEEQRAEFQGNVRLTDPETYLEADSLTYYRDQERSIASGEVFIRRTGSDEESPRNTTTRTYLFGQWADNQEQNQYSLVRGNALLVRVRADSAGKNRDTLIVRGRRLEAFRTKTHRRLIAVDSVRIWERDLAATADSAVYDRVVATGPLDTTATPRPVPDSTAPAPPAGVKTSSPMPLPDTARTAPAPAGGGPSLAEARPVPSEVPPSPDTANTTAAPDTAGGSLDETPDGWEAPVARRAADVPLEDIRLFRSPTTWFERSQVWGDSIRVRAHDRRLDTVFVRGAAFAAQRDSALDRIQQLKGKNLTAVFRADSLRRIAAGPNALAIRFLTTSTGNLKGAAKVSGDRIVLRFRKGTVKRTSVLGGVQSTYYRIPSAVPMPFHLQGFRWTPEHTPQKATLLREPRVRERLGLPTVPLQAHRASPFPDSTSTERNSSAERTEQHTLDQDNPSSDSSTTQSDSAQRRRAAPTASPPDSRPAP